MAKKMPKIASPLKKMANAAKGRAVKVRPFKMAGVVEKIKDGSAKLAQRKGKRA